MVWYIFFFLDTLLFIFKIIFLTFDDYKLSKKSRKWALKHLKRAKIEVEVIGKENIPSKACLFVANHQSYFDILFFLAFIENKKGFVAKIELAKIPFLKTAMKRFKCIFLDRGNLRQNLISIKEGIKILKDDHSLVIFPEGTWRWEDEGKMLPFKKGSFKLATESSVPIVPVTIINAHKIMPKGDKRIRKTTVTFVIHKHIETKNLTPAEKRELSNKTYQIINNSLQNNK